MYAATALHKQVISHIANASEIQLLSVKAVLCSGLAFSPESQKLLVYRHRS